MTESINTIIKKYNLITSEDELFKSARFLTQKILFSAKSRKETAINIYELDCILDRIEKIKNK